MDDRWFRLGDHGRYPAYMNRYFKFSIATLLALTFLFACFFGWLTHERKPRVDELLYWDVTQGLKEYVVKEAECGIHSEEPGAFFLTFTCLASPDYGNDPYIEVSLLCLLYTSPSPRDLSTSRMPSSA